MRGYHHIELSLFTGLILLAPFFLQFSVIVFLILAGIFLGSLLPDSDASDRTAKHSESVLGVFDIINETFIYPILLKIFHENKKHRGILHTLVGVFTYSLILSSISAIILFFLKVDLNMILFGLGLFFGGVLHLMEDCCTYSGVNPFYPKYKNSIFKGNISTNDDNEKRPDQFGKFLMFSFVGIIVGEIYFHIPTLTIFFISVATICLSWFVFFKICNVKKSFINKSY
jgi:inner membrane protein